MLLRRGLLALVIATVALVSVACGSSSSSATHHSAGIASAEGPHQTCVAGTTLTTMAQFEKLVGFDVNCADVYDDAAATWSDWDKPWFIDNNIAADNWVPFSRNGSDQLTITLSLIPDSVLSGNWRAAGAAGDYTQYAKTLARNLIAAHMGGSVIRLATEANGTWEKDSIGNTPTQWRQWAAFWRKTVLAMKSVPGAKFSFDWGINNGYRPIPFQDYYPGNDVVDSIGVDVYDTAPQGTTNRWGYVDDESGGMKAIAAFAKQQGKPLIIPEWGLEPTSGGGGGDDPSFVSGLASFVKSTPVTSDAYFFDENTATALEDAPKSLAVYKADFKPPAVEK